MRLKPQTYAITSATSDRRRIFKVHANSELMMQVLERNRSLGRLLLHGFAIMPDHIHLLLTPVESVEKTMQYVKGGFSFQARKQVAGEIWQKSYHAHRVVDSLDYDNQLGYIARNPVQAGLGDWRFVHTSREWRTDAKPVYLGG